MTLEYLKVLTAWPVATIAIVGTIIWTFGPNLGRLIDDLRSLDTPMGKMERQPIAMPPVVDPLAQKANSLQTPAAQQINRILPPALAGTEAGTKFLAYVEANPGPTIAEYTRLQTAFSAERISRYIFRSQIELLDDMVAKGDTRTMVEIGPYHRRAAESIGAKDYPLENYIDFMVSFGLIEVVGEQLGTYRATVFGARYLDYMKKEYKEQWNNFAH